MDDTLAAVTIGLVSIAALPVGVATVGLALALPPALYTLLAAIVPFPGVLVGSLGVAVIGAGVTGGIVAIRTARPDRSQHGRVAAE